MREILQGLIQAVISLFLIFSCQWLLVMMLLGVALVIARCGLGSFALSLWCIGFPASFVLGFLLAVRLGRLVLLPRQRNV